MRVEIGQAVEHDFARPMFVPTNPAQLSLSPARITFDTSAVVTTPSAARNASSRHGRRQILESPLTVASALAFLGNAAGTELGLGVRGATGLGVACFGVGLVWARWIR